VCVIVVMKEIMKAITCYYFDLRNSINSS